MPGSILANKRKQIFSLIATSCKKTKTIVPQNPSYDDLYQEFIQYVTLATTENLTQWFVETKQKLNILADRRIGIISEYKLIKASQRAEDQSVRSMIVDEEDKEVYVYLRDARNQTSNRGQKGTLPAFENWAIMGVNAFQTVHRIISNNTSQTNQDEIIKIQKELEAKCRTFLNEISNSEHPQELAFLTIQTVLVPILAEHLNIKPKEAKAIINRLKDFSNLDEHPCTLVTVYKVKEKEQEKEFAQIDVPLYQLTETQQLEYLAVLKCARLSIPNTFFYLENKIPENLPQWYSAIEDEHTQRMIQHYIPQILEGRQIPTQMLDLLPGLRNAGEERIYNLSEKELPQQIMQSFHAGSMGQDTDAGFAENVRLAKENIKQFQALTGVEEVRINSWISPWFISWLSGFKGANESRLYYVQRQAVKELNDENNNEFKVIYSNTPLEYTRAILSSDRAVENSIWQDALKKLAEYTGNSDIESLIAKATKEYPDGIYIKQAKKILSITQPISLDHGEKEISEQIQNKLLNADGEDSIWEVLKGYHGFPSAIIEDAIEQALLRATVATEQHVLLSVVLKDYRAIQNSIQESHAKLFQHMVELQRLRAFSTSSFTFGLQVNAQRAAKYKQMQSLINTLEVVEGHNPRSALVTGCKSGKDREGLLAILIVVDIVVAAFKGVSTQLAKIGSKKTVESQVAERIVEAEHITTRAGLQGGSLGARGIKNDGRVLPIWLQNFFSIIAKKEAKSNKKVKKEKDLKQEDVNNVKSQVKSILTANGEEAVIEAEAVVERFATEAERKSLSHATAVGSISSTAMVEQSLLTAHDNPEGVKGSATVSVAEAVVDGLATEAERTDSLDVGANNAEFFRKQQGREIHTGQDTYTLTINLDS